MDSGWEVSIYKRSIVPELVKLKKQFPKLLNIFELTNAHLARNQNPIFLLISDQEHDSFIETYASSISPNTLFLYAHGYSQTAYQLNKKFPKFQHAMFAFKSIAREIRENYLTKSLIMAAIDDSLITQDHSLTHQWLLDMAQAVGVKKHLVTSTFQEECMTDLFTEQTILCYFLPFLSAQSFEILKDKGISSEMAFIESFYEMQLILNSLMRVGPAKFFSLISQNALMGAEWARTYYQDGITKEKMVKHLALLGDMDLKSFFTKENYEQAKKNNQSFWENHPFQKAFEHWKNSCQ